VLIIAATRLAGMCMSDGGSRLDYGIGGVSPGSRLALAH